jgi:hypothetical protein
MSECIICGASTENPIRAALWHFRPYVRGGWANWKYLPGNTELAGSRLLGILSVISLMFPLFNTLRFWRYRKCTLVLSDGRPLEAVFNEKGCSIMQPSTSTAEHGK